MGEIICGDNQKAVCNMQSKIVAIDKSRKNKDQGYSFRGIDDVYNQMHPIMSECNVFSVVRQLSRDEEVYTSKTGTRMHRVILKTEYDFIHIDGSKITVGPIYTEAIDSSDKATNKAASVAHRTAFIQLLCIPTEDEKDADLTSPVIPPDAVKSGPIFHRDMSPKQPAAPIAPPKPLANHAPKPIAGAVSQQEFEALWKVASSNGWIAGDMTRVLNAYGCARPSELDRFSFDEMAKAINAGANPQDIIAAKKG